MKVLHVIPSLALCHGGPSTALPIMERALTSCAIEVETITTDDDGPGQRNGKGDGHPRRENGVTRRYFRKDIEIYKVSRAMGNWLVREVGGFDLVHVHGLFSHTSVAACRAARRAGVPYVVRPLGVLTNYGVQQRRPWLKKVCLRWIDGPLLRDASAVHFTLAAEQREAETLGISMRSKVVPLGIEPIELLPVEADRPPFALFLSRVDPKKNLDGLLDAWAALREDCGPEEWRLVIAGKGNEDYERQLRARSRELGIEKSVEWAGHVEGAAKSRLLADAALYVLPSFSENFGIAAAEAMLVGKPSLFSPGVAVGAEAAEQGAALLAGPDPGSLASGLHELMTDDKRRRSLGMAARHFAETELSAALMGRRLKALYESLIETSHAAS